MRLSPVLWMTCLAGALAACAAGPRPLRGPEPLEWRTLLGCYRPTHGPGVGFFALDSTVLSSSVEGERVARSLMSLPDYAREYWRVTDRNTVVFVQHAGLWGKVMEYVVRGDSLVGRTHVFTDVIGRREPPREPVAAVRAPCPSGGSAPAP